MEVKMNKQNSNVKIYSAKSEALGIFEIIEAPEEVFRQEIITWKRTDYGFIKTTATTTFIGDKERRKEQRTFESQPFPIST